MTNFAIRVIANAAALWVAALLVSGIDLAQGDSTWPTKLVTVLLVALVFGVVNAFIRPIVKLLSLPLLVLTLGLFTFIVNAFMLQITEWLAGPLGLDFHIQRFFWDAVMGAVIITIVSWAVSVLLPSSD